MKVKQIIEDISWMPHSLADGVKIKPMVSKKEDGLDVTCMLVFIPVGREVPEHIHADQDDILYPLKGRAVMWVEGSGEFPLEPGVVVRVPKGVRHKVINVSEDILIYDVFTPALL